MLEWEITRVWHQRSERREDTCCPRWCSYCTGHSWSTTVHHRLSWFRKRVGAWDLDKTQERADQRQCALCSARALPGRELLCGGLCLDLGGFFAIFEADTMNQHWDFKMRTRLEVQLVHYGKKHIFLTCVDVTLAISENSDAPKDLIPRTN